MEQRRGRKKERKKSKGTCVEDGQKVERKINKLIEIGMGENYRKKWKKKNEKLNENLTEEKR